jgi:hypothetical protein
MIRKEDLQISSLGGGQIHSPLRPTRDGGFVRDSARLLYEVEIDDRQAPDPRLTFELAGPRERLFFEPAKTTAAIVTCGGLCPGLNNVIRSCCLELLHNYRVPRFLGIRSGYMGLNPEIGTPPSRDWAAALVKEGNRVVQNTCGGGVRRCFGSTGTPARRAGAKVRDLRIGSLPHDSIRQARRAMVPCHRWESDVLASLDLHRPLHQRIEERTWDFRRRARVVERPSNST